MHAVNTEEKSGPKVHVSLSDMYGKCQIFCGANLLATDKQDEQICWRQMIHGQTDTQLTHHRHTQTDMTDRQTDT